MGQLWCWAGRGAAPRRPPCHPYSHSCQIPSRAGNKILPDSGANTWFLLLSLVVLWQTPPKALTKHQPIQGTRYARGVLPFQRL